MDDDFVWAFSTFFTFLFIFFSFGDLAELYVSNNLLEMWEVSHAEKFLPQWGGMKEEIEEIPLKTILQNFLNHVETLETARDEGEDQYEKEFQVWRYKNLFIKKSQI